METYTEQDFHRTRKKVYKILNSYPETREGSPLLTILYLWRDIDGLPDWVVEQIIKYNIKHGLTDTESIRRARQILQNNKGIFRPSRQTDEQRADRAQEIKKIVKKWQRS